MCLCWMCTHGAQPTSGLTRFDSTSLLVMLCGDRALVILPPGASQKLLQSQILKVRSRILASHLLISCSYQTLNQQTSCIFKQHPISLGSNLDHECLGQSDVLLDLCATSLVWIPEVSLKPWVLLGLWGKERIPGRIRK